MESEKFDLVFKGQLLPKREIDEVKVNLAQLFKIAPAQVDALFLGKAVVLKRNIDLEAANRYRIAIKNAGARVDLVKSGAAITTHNAAPENQTLVAEPLKTPLSRAPSAEPVPSSKQLTLSEIGGDLLKPEERKKEVVLDIDLSALSLRNGGNLVDQDEISRDLPLIISELEAEILPLGSDLIRDIEKKPSQKSEIKPLNADLAPAGARLAPQKNDDVAPPNVDHIQLV